MGASQALQMHSEISSVVLETWHCIGQIIKNLYQDGLGGTTQTLDHVVVVRPKAVPRYLQNHVVWSGILKCSVKPYVTGPSTKCYSNESLFTRALTHDKLEQRNSCGHSECHDLPLLCETYLQEVVFEKNPSEHET